MSRGRLHYADRKDNSHREVVETLSALGCSIHTLPSIAESIPDLLVGVAGRTFVVEAKNPGTRDDFTADQDEFWALWRGNPKIVLTDRDDALAWVLKVRREL